MIRTFDFILSLLGLILLLPVLLIIGLFVVVDSGFPVLFRQKRVGRGGKTFKLIKFRTMKKGSDEGNFLTVGLRDSRITGLGYFLRKYKLDELPQLLNVLKGEMSFVGPRPEVEQYVKLYTAEQREVLDVRPGITDLASLEYRMENEILGEAMDPGKTYIEQIMPHKIEINLNYLKRRTLISDITVIARTLVNIFR